MEVLCQRSEACGSGRDFIVIGEKRGGVKDSAVIGGDGTRGASAHRLEAYSGVDDGKGLSILYRAGNGREITLCKATCRQSQGTHDQRQSSHGLPHRRFLGCVGTALLHECSKG